MAAARAGVRGGGLVGLRLTVRMALRRAPG
jgi:hypothetical protein